MKITNRTPARTGADIDIVLYKNVKIPISIAKNPINVTIFTNKFQRKTKNPMTIFFNL